MLENVIFVVWWSRGEASADSRRFEDVEAAKGFFEEVTADPKTHKARLLEVLEKEIRSFEHEGGGAAPVRRQRAHSVETPDSAM